MKTVLFVVSEVGFTWEEVIRPFKEFLKAGFEVVIATPNGNKPKIDPLSIKPRPILQYLGLGISLKLSPKSSTGKKLKHYLNKPISLATVKESAFVALYIAGGHGSLFDLNKNTNLHKLILKFNANRKPIGVICHASSTLVFIQKNGRSFAYNRNITGFPTLWEHLVLFTKQIHPSFLPLPLWTGKELDHYATGRSFLTRIQEVINPYFTLKDDNIISGVGPKSGGIIAQKIISLL